MGRMPETTFDIFFISAGMYMVVLVGVAIHFVKEVFNQQEEQYKLHEKQISTELKLKETRLKMLQNQLHPHMLFNSLNMIYGHSLKKSDKTPGMVINLSNMLDYMLYRCEDERILLEKEIDFLKDYIELEKNKFNDELILDVKWPDRQNEFLIAPLILLPFCENCFKHVKHTINQQLRIKIRGVIDGNKLVFSTLNTFNSDSRKSEMKGIGIQNVKERLKMIYSEKYDLTVDEKNDQYKLQLTLELDPVY